MAGSPYDEDTFMPMPLDAQQSHMNTWLNRRLDSRLDRSPGMGEIHRMMSERIPHMMTPPGYDPTNPSGQRGLPSGSDMEMMMLYGPEDRVVYDASGRPIRLDDPRHPQNQQQNYNALRSYGYPQNRR